ncbi:hypothetical protein DFH07DRAFT_780149 [Mycena maculata]|uniref:Uncharacterized protein n=1 Tax=Mycena maculata TaxID=230809 RepID=A0AAD7I674_9AGAR|nr:hypothetical protein DFH07DRAFT_780149 [Mycena maculata]
MILVALILALCFPSPAFTAPVAGQFPAYARAEACQLDSEMDPIMAKVPANLAIVVLNLGLLLILLLFFKQQCCELLDIQLQEALFQHAVLQMEARRLSSPPQPPPVGVTAPIDMFSTDSTAALVPVIQIPTRRF